MREITVSAQDAGQRLDRLIPKLFPRLPLPLLQKSIRKKRVKLNGAKAEMNVRLSEGDRIALYINDEFLDRPVSGREYRLIERPRVDIRYEDGNILIVNKPAGMPCQPDARETVNTLVNHIKAYLTLSGAWLPEDLSSFEPALCNRIDRNTAGLVIAAKNAAALREMNRAIRSRQVEKHYLCVTHGRPNPAESTLEGYLVKDSARNMVRVVSESHKNAMYAAMSYRTLESSGGFSLVECSLITGRTHQIRAMMAALGCPLLGDGKYGRSDGASSQALLSQGVKFNISSGPLSYLKGKTVKLPTRGFRKLYEEAIIAKQNN